MFETLTVDGVEFKINPDTCFWGTGRASKLHKLYRKVQERLVFEMEEFRFKSDIILLYVNPTDRCNANCPYCYLPRRIKSRGQSMTYRELEIIMHKALEFFKEKNIKGSIIFHGSEPLLNKDNIFRIIEDYRDSLHFGIQTNGLLLDREDVEFIKNLRINIGISLDSPLEKVNDMLRSPGHYKQVMRILGWFKDYKGLNVVTTITNHNVTHLTDMVRLLNSRGVKLCLMNPVRGTQTEALSLRPDPERLATEFIDAVEEAIKLSKDGRRIVVADFANILLGVVAPSARVMMCDISPCGGGRRFLSITADGTAYPCGEFIGMEEFAGGNIYSDSIEEIANSDNFAPVTQRSVEMIPECRSCPIRNMCGAPCPAEIYSAEGDMLRKSYYCYFYRKIVEHAFRVIYRGDVEHVLNLHSLREVYSLNKK